MLFDLILNNDSSMEEIHNFCNDNWKKQSNFFIKIIFFIRDRQKGYFFTECMSWLFINHEKHFFNNLSHIMGIYNKNSISDLTLEILFRSSFIDTTEKLREFVDGHDSFMENWYSETRAIFFKHNDIPVYGEWDDLFSIYYNLKYLMEEGKFTGLTSDRLNKLYNSIMNLIVTSLKMKKCLLSSIVIKPDDMSYLRVLLGINIHNYSLEEGSNSSSVYLGYIGRISFGERYLFIK